MIKARLLGLVGMVLVALAGTAPAGRALSLHNLGWTTSPVEIGHAVAQGDLLFETNARAQNLHIPVFGICFIHSSSYKPE